MRAALPAGGSGEGGLAATSDGFGGFPPAAPPAGPGAVSVRCSRGADAPGLLLSAGTRLTRRDLLAGAAVGGAVPAGLASPGRRGAPGEREAKERAAWETALAALRRAEGEVAAFKAAEAKGASSAAQWALDEAFSDLVSAQNEALERLLLVPAPDVAALAVKLALAVEELAWELPEGEATMARIAEDAIALAGTCL